MNPFSLPISQLTIDAVQAASVAAIVKHGVTRTTLSSIMASRDKLAILMEECGESAHQLTYDIPDDKAALVKELLQVASVALLWVESIEGQTDVPRT